MIRIVTERSSMKNNDEFVIFKKDLEDLPKKTVFYRPVTEKERELGLSTSYEGRRADEKRPRLSTVLDEIKRFKTHLKREERVALKTGREFDMVHALCRMVSTHFLSCMSGGCHPTYLGAIRHLLKKNNVDPGHEINLDYTVQDFYNETEGNSIRKLFKESWLDT